jgi:hypothetical protein
MQVKCESTERIHSTKFLRDFFHGEERKYPEDEDVDRELWVRQMYDQCLTGILHCLDPMEGMVKGLEPGAGFYVRETLWDGRKCRIDVERM